MRCGGWLLLRSEIDIKNTENKLSYECNNCAVSSASSVAYLCLCTAILSQMADCSVSESYLPDDVGRR